ncbi:hypothetical protein BC629DRAFT_1196527 [Irpex lacteus]|nr:hypothetical protein BC629DRAFT_1196527 [Irpex lacteus]
MTWVYALTRYATALLCIWTIIPVGSLEVTTCSCKASQYIDYILVLTQYICYASFSALRAYALLDGTPKTLISGTIFLLNLVPFASNLYDYATSIVFMDTDVCTSVSTMSVEHHLMFSLATRIAVIAGDVLVLAVTWSKTARLYLEARKLKIRAPLASMLIYDGTCYFVILLLLNVMQVLQSHVRVLSAAQIEGRFLTVPPDAPGCPITNLSAFALSAIWAPAKHFNSGRMRTMKKGMMTHNLTSISPGESTLSCPRCLLRPLMKPMFLGIPGTIIRLTYSRVLCN